MNEWHRSVVCQIPYSLKLLILSSFVSDAQVLFYHDWKISVVNKEYRHKTLELFKELH